MVQSRVNSFVTKSVFNIYYVIWASYFSKIGIMGAPIS